MNTTVTNLFAKTLLNSNLFSLQPYRQHGNLFISKSKFSHSFSSLIYSKSLNTNIKMFNTKLTHFLDSVIRINQDDLLQNEIITDTYKSNDENIEINNCVFKGLRSTDDGSAINVQNTNGKYILVNSIFQDCRSGRKGGAIFAKAKSFILKGCCFHLCRCGTENGSDGSTIYIDASDFINTSFITCHECPKHGDSCWYGICNLWNADLYTNNVNISKSETEYVCSVAHCEPARQISHLTYYTSVNGLAGNSLTFVNMRFPGHHQYGNIINNSVKSGLIYFQNSKVEVKNFVFRTNSGPLTYSCVGISNGTFISCIFDRKHDPGNGFDSTIDCKIRLRNITDVEMKLLSTFMCEHSDTKLIGINSQEKVPFMLMIAGCGVILILIVTYWKQILYFGRKLVGRRHK